MDDGWLNILELLINKGEQAIPIVSLLLSPVILYFYRKDYNMWREQSRQDFKESIDAVNKNTNVLERVALIVQMRMEDK